MSEEVGQTKASNDTIVAYDVIGIGHLLKKRYKVMYGEGKPFVFYPDNNNVEKDTGFYIPESERVKLISFFDPNIIDQDDPKNDTISFKNSNDKLMVNHFKSRAKNVLDRLKIEYTNEQINFDKRLLYLGKIALDNEIQFQRQKHLSKVENSVTELEKNRINIITLAKSANNSISSDKQNGYF